MRPATSTTHSTRRAALLAVPAALFLAAPIAPVANAQLPGGMSPEEVQSMIPGEISVPAGESTTVDVGVPVDVNYSSGGWTVTSSGTSVTVSAPNQPGATAAVPASAGGYSATVNLVAVGDGSADVGGDTGAGSGQSGSSGGSGGGAGGAAAGGGDANGATDGGSDTSGGEGAAGSSNGAAGEGSSNQSGEDGSAPAASHPSRSKAEPADDAAATKLYFDGEIQDNTIVVKVPLSRVKDLMKYASYDTEGATLRYLDVNGQVIEGVEREIDKGKRTITLTYPEGETPDNPFIMEMVRDGKADFVAVITSTNVPIEQAGDSNADNQYGNYANQEGQGRGVDESSTISDVLPLAIAGAALLAAIALLVVFLRRRRAQA